jgi:hypothetical protein
MALGDTGRKCDFSGPIRHAEAPFALGTAVPPDARRLNAVDVFALSASLEAFTRRRTGWITLSEARALFSPMDDQYPFGEMDGPMAPGRRRAGAQEPDGRQRRAPLGRSSISCTPVPNETLMPCSQPCPSCGRADW